MEGDYCEKIFESYSLPHFGLALSPLLDLPLSLCCKLPTRWIPLPLSHLDGFDCLKPRTKEIFSFMCWFSEVLSHMILPSMIQVSQLQRLYGSRSYSDGHREFLVLFLTQACGCLWVLSMWAQLLEGEKTAPPPVGTRCRLHPEILSQESAWNWSHPQTFQACLRSRDLLAPTSGSCLVSH